MRREKVIDLVARGREELAGLITRRRDELDELRFRHARGELKATHTLKMRRRDLARAETALGQVGRHAEGAKR